MISIKRVKERFSSKYPETPLSTILLREPQELTESEFLAKALTWLSVLDYEKNEAQRVQSLMRGEGTDYTRFP